MKKASKSLQKTDDTTKRAVSAPAPVKPKPPAKRVLSLSERVQAMDPDSRMSIARRIIAEAQPDNDRRLGRVESFKRVLRSGDAGETQRVIDAANRDRLADEAVREHIAELIDAGREVELTAQLRAYAVMYLVHPIQIMRRRDGD